ncbi:MAG: transposase [Gemmataceae bacterium]
MAQRRYTDEEKATALAALAANGGNVDRTARELSIPRKTLERWARGGVHPQVAQSGQEKRLPLVDVFEDIARRSLGCVTDEKLKNTDAQKLVTTAAIATDKAQLLRGQPTRITEDVSKLTDAELDAERIRLEETLRRSAAGTGPSANGDALAELPAPAG